MSDPAEAGSGGEEGARRFELVAGSSAKFWECQWTEAGYRIRFGKIGTAGQTRSKALAAPDARTAVARLIAEKVAKGYAEVTGATPTPGSAHEPAGSPDWTTTGAWQALFRQLKASGGSSSSEIATPSDADLDAFEAAMGFRLPASYRAYMKVFGPGEYCSSHVLYAPMPLGSPYTRTILEYHASFVKDVVEQQDYVSERGSKIEPIRHMVIFGEDIAPTLFGWDLADTRDPATHEYAIRHFDDEYDSCPVVAASFPEFINDFVLGRCQKRQAEDPDSYGFTYSPNLRTKGWHAKNHPEAKTKTPKKAAQAKAAAPAPDPTSPPTRPERSPVEERQLMLAAIADPADPDPWLAYAGWLDGFKDTFAALIRLRLGDPTAAESAREAKLIAALGKEWNQYYATAGLLPALLNRLHQHTQLTYNDDDQLAHVRLIGDLVNARVLAALASSPALQSLEISDHQLAAEEVEAVARIRTLRELRIHSGTTDNDLAMLARLDGLESLMLTRHRLAPASRLRDLARLPRLRSLHLDSPADPEWRVPAEALACLREFPALRHLNLGGNDFGGAALTEVGHLTQLEHLGWSHNPISDEDLPPLSRLVHLRSLRVDGPKFTNAGLVHLEPLQELEKFRFWILDLDDRGMASIGKLANLRKLDVLTHQFEDDSRSVTDAGVVHLAGLTRLVELDLSATRLTDASMTPLAGLIALETLNLNYQTGITGPGFVHLAGLPRLKNLTMRLAKLTDAAIAHLATLSHLEVLDIYDCEARATDAATEHLARLTQLRELQLTSWPLTDAAIPPLAALPHLEILDLSGARLTDAAVPHLLAFPALKTLNLSAGKLSAAAKRQLRAAFAAGIW